MIAHVSGSGAGVSLGGGLGRGVVFGDQLGPDQVPISWAKRAPRDKPASGALDGDAALNGHGPLTFGPTGQVWGMSPDLLAERSLTATLGLNVLGEVEFHGAHLSAPLSAMQSRRAVPASTRRAVQCGGMKTVEETRLARLLQLREEHGSLAKLNALLGLSARDSTLSQIVNGSAGSKSGKPKTMGSPMARRLEEACQKERGWMDLNPDFDDASGPHDPHRALLLETFEQLPPTPERRQRAVAAFVAQVAAMLPDQLPPEPSEEPTPGQRRASASHRSATSGGPTQQR